MSLPHIALVLCSSLLMVCSAQTCNSTYKISRNADLIEGALQVSTSELHKAGSNVCGEKYQGKPNQKWCFHWLDSENFTIANAQSGWCMGVPKNTTAYSGNPHINEHGGIAIEMQPCSAGNRYQVWQAFIHFQAKTPIPEDEFAAAIGRNVSEFTAAMVAGNGRNVELVNVHTNQLTSFAFDPNESPKLMRTFGRNTYYYGGWRIKSV